MKFLKSAGFFLLAISVLLVGSTSLGNMHRVQKACAADIKKFCADKPADELKNCVTENLNKFSPGCKAEFDSKTDSIVKTCRSDFKKLCPGKKGPALQKCFTKRQDKLSKACKASIGVIKN